MIVLWLPERNYPLALRIGGSIVGVVLAIVGFIFPVFRYLKRAGAASAEFRLETGPTMRRMLWGVPERRGACRQHGRRCNWLRAGRASWSKPGPSGKDSIPSPER